MELFSSCLFYMFAGGVLPSALGAFLGLSGASAGVVTIIAAGINLIVFAILIYKLFDFRMSVPGKGRYYLYNMTAGFVYCAIAVVSSAALELLVSADNSIFKTIYTFLFFNFKTLRYATYSDGYILTTTRSALIYSCIYLALIAILPLFINKRKLLGISTRRKGDRG